MLLALIFGANSNSKAWIRCQLRGLVCGGLALITVPLITGFVGRTHPCGLEVYLLALLATIPFLCGLGVMGRYLYEEQDEFQRTLMVRALLWTVAIMQGLTAFMGLLQHYGVVIAVPLLMEFVAFWGIFCVLSTVQMILNRVRADDQPARGDVKGKVA